MSSATWAASSIRRSTACSTARGDIVDGTGRWKAGGTLGEWFIRQPTDPYAGYSIKWDGEWQVTYETFRDMGIAYAVGLILIYLLVVAHFKSYLVPLIIMAPIPLTIIGVMPGHALLGSAIHRDLDDRHDRAGRHHRPQLDPAGRFHPAAGRRAAWTSAKR